MTSKKKSASALEVTAEQIRYFRARRSHLIGEGASDVVACASEIMGAQAQVHTCALHALSMRTRGRPDAAEIERAIFEDHSLVRTWGQRDTLHLYDANDWPTVAASLPNWGRSGRRGGLPAQDLLDDMEAIFAASDEPLARSDLMPSIPQEYVDALRDHDGAGKDPARFAATRIIWQLAKNGRVAFASMSGKEQAYAHRAVWWDEVTWPETPLDADAASAKITRKYLAAFGPATVQDIAHYLGARVTDCRRWVKEHMSDLIHVTCGEESKTMLALAADEDALRGAIGDWPARMLPAYDTMLMTHKNKRIILPDVAEEKLVWKRAAVVRATVIDRGQIVATWSHKKRSKHVDITIEPLSGWDGGARDDVEVDANHFAAHLGLELGALEVA